MIFSGPGGLTYVAPSNSGITINVGRGPTDDNPAVTLENPRDLDRASSFLNIRVKDIEAVYAEWSNRGVQYLMPPKQDQYESRCHIGGPDEYLIEGGQTAARRGAWSFWLPSPLNSSTHHSSMRRCLRALPIPQPSARQAGLPIDSSTKRWVVSEPARSATCAAASPTDTEIPARIVE